MKRISAAVQTARALLARGVLGRSLLEGLQEAHPTLTLTERDGVMASVRGEVGVLGQAAHDPNLYPSCKVASAEKDRHPAPHGLVATVATPMCASCAYNRSGSCSLMGGRLVASSSDLSLEDARRSAEGLVADGSLTRREAGAVLRAASLGASQKVAALHLKARFKKEDARGRVVAEAQSRRSSAMLDGDLSGFDKMTRPHALRLGGHLANADDPGMDQLFGDRPGDEAQSAGSRSAARVLGGRKLSVNVPEIRPLAGGVEIAPENKITLDLSPLGSGKSRKAGLGVSGDEKSDTRGLFGHKSGDNAVARRAAAVADVLAGSYMDVQLPGEAEKPTRVKLASTSVFDVPENSGEGRVAGAAADEHIEQVQGAFDALVRKASRALAAGRMTASRADRVLVELEQFHDQGAVATTWAERVAGQLRPLCGGLEL